MDRDVSHLVDIVRSARIVQSYLDGVTQSAFIRNVQLQDSVIRRLEIIGEAAGRVSLSFRGKHPAIPWSRMIGMRNRVIHMFTMQSIWTSSG